MGVEWLAALVAVLPQGAFGAGTAGAIAFATWKFIIQRHLKDQSEAAERQRQVEQENRELRDRVLKLEHTTVTIKHLHECLDRIDRTVYQGVASMEKNLDRAIQAMRKRHSDGDE